MIYPLVELDIFGILTQTFRLCKENAKFLLTIAAVFLILDATSSQLFDWIAPTTPTQLEHDSAANAVPLPASWGRLAVAGICMLFMFVLYILCVGTATRGVIQRYSDRDEPIRDSFHFVWKRLGRITLAAIISMAGIAVWGVFFILPGVYLSYTWFVIYPVLMYEEVHATEALQRSRKLMQGHKIKALAIAAPAFLLAMLVGFGWTVIPEPVATVISEAMNTAYSIFGCVLAAVVYFSARSRMETLATKTLSQLSANDTEGAPDIAAG